MRPKSSDVVGHKITRVRWLNRAEMEALGWEDYQGHGGGGVAIELDNGVLVAQQDEEGNGPGAFYFNGEKCDGVLFPNQRR